MSLEKVVQSIREEGRRSADVRLNEARKEAAAILADAERQAAAIRAQKEQETARTVETLRSRESAAGELEAKKVRLNAQKEALARVRAAVLERLGGLPDAKRLEHIQALVRGSSVQNGKILVAQRDADAARKAGLAVAGTIPTMGGVVVLSADGSTREDLTYETLVEEVWSGSLHDVAGVLFGK